MKSAWKELKYNWKKYLLVEIMVILMMFMVLFLSGLVKGLGRAVSSGVENMDADTFILSDDAEKLITDGKAIIFLYNRIPVSVPYFNQKFFCQEGSN